MSSLEIGKSVTLREGSGVAILNFGTLLPAAREAAEALDATLVDMRWVKPLHEGRVLELAEGHELLVTAEENAVAGGAGTAVSELLSRAGVGTPALHLGLPDDFVDHGDHSVQLADWSLDASGIANSVRRRIDSMSPSSPVIPAQAGIQRP